MANKMPPKKTPGKKPEKVVSEVERLRIVLPKDYLREITASHAMALMIANMPASVGFEAMAQSAVEGADALVAELGRGK